MKATITITVAGPAGAGKTTVACLLSAELTRLGISHTLQVERAERELFERFVNDRISALRQKVQWKDLKIMVDEMSEIRLVRVSEDVNPKTWGAA